MRVRRHATSRSRGRASKVAVSNHAPANNVDAGNAELACVLGVDLFPTVDTRAAFRSAYRNVDGEKPARGLADSRPSGSLPERIRDLPPLSCPNEMQVLAVHHGSDCDSRNGVVDIYDLDLNAKIIDDAGGFLAQPPGRCV